MCCFRPQVELLLRALHQQYLSWAHASGHPITANHQPPGRQLLFLEHAPQLPLVVLMHLQANMRLFVGGSSGAGAAQQTPSPPQLPDATSTHVPGASPPKLSGAAQPPLANAPQGMLHPPNPPMQSGQLVVVQWPDVAPVRQPLGPLMQQAMAGQGQQERWQQGQGPQQQQGCQQGQQQQQGQGQQQQGQGQGQQGQGILQQGVVIVPLAQLTHQLCGLLRTHAEARPFHRILVRGALLLFAWYP